MTSLKVYSGIELASAFTGASLIEADNRASIENVMELEAAAGVALGLDLDTLPLGPQYTKYREDTKAMMKEQVPQLEYFSQAMRAYIELNESASLTDSEKYADLRRLADAMVPPRTMAFSPR